MTAFFDKNRTLRNNFPIEKSPPGEINAITKMVHLILDSAVEGAGAGSPLLNGDTVTGENIPEGALIYDALVVSPTGGATGIVDFGHLAGLDKDGVAIAADPNGFIQQADAGGQAVRKSADNASASMELKVGKGGLVPQLTVTEDFVNDVVIHAYVFYSLES